MTSQHFRLRRATLDDLGQLATLWEPMGFSTPELSRRVTEFQVVEGSKGVVLGAIALHAVERQGLLHSEAFADFSQADELRGLLWERLLGVAANQGLWRIWTRETAPFWVHSGLARAGEQDLASLPAAWREGHDGWLTIKLREDVETIMKADANFAVFMAQERQKTAKTASMARAFRIMVTVIAFALAALALAAIYVLYPKMPRPPGN